MSLWINLKNWRFFEFMNKWRNATPPPSNNTSFHFIPFFENGWNDWNGVCWGLWRHQANASTKKTWNLLIVLFVDVLRAAEQWEGWLSCLIVFGWVIGGPLAHGNQPKEKTSSSISLSFHFLCFSFVEETKQIERNEGEIGLLFFSLLF